VLDQASDRVVGMLSFYMDEKSPPNRFAYAIPAEQIVAGDESLRLWPDAYGPQEWRAYLRYLADLHGQLTLPDGRKVPLEKVYVSLRADQMNAAERQAEHELYLQDVEVLMETVAPEERNPYVRFNVMRSVIARQPRMQMLVSRNWQAQFSQRKDQRLNLAELIQQHNCAALLGDPGSGKTTLGRWITLQESLALLENRQNLIIQRDQVQTHSSKKGKEEPLLDLGQPRLPIFIRISAYARARWDAAGLDTELSLDDFILTGKLNEKRPAGQFARRNGRPDLPGCPRISLRPGHPGRPRRSRRPRPAPRGHAHYQ
jgi:hypothetical protein